MPPTLPPPNPCSPRTLRDVLDSGELDEERRWCVLPARLVLLLLLGTAAIKLASVLSCCF